MLILFTVLFLTKESENIKWLILFLDTVMTKKCLKDHTYLFYGQLIYLIHSSLLCMFTHMCIVFSSHGYYMVNSKLSS